MDEKRIAEKERYEIRQAVRDFADVMLDKMLAKYEAGYRGWNDKKNKIDIWDKLDDNINDNDWIDVANLAMMLYGFQRKA